MKIEINKAPNLLTNGFVKTSGSDGSLGVDTNTYLTSVGTGVANEITYWSGTNALGSLATATYPSLTELSYVKGVTSAIQTQLNAKGAGTVTTLSVVSANGFAGTVANATTTPAITLTTSITGVLKGNGTAISAATAGSDYAVGSIGLAGGQTIAGSTLTTENLTLRANAADLTTGAVIVSSSKEATSSTVGSVQLAGGLAVAKRVYALDMTVTNTITGSISGNAGTASAVAVGGITGLGTGVATALAVNVGSAGSPVVNGGALGTPSSGTLTNATGLPAASIVAGIIGVTGTRMTKIWTTDLESTNMPTVGGTAILTSLTAPQFTTIELGHASDTTLSRVSAGVVSIEGNNIMTVASTDTITGAKTFNNTVVLGEVSMQLDPAISADGKWSGITETGTVGASTLAFGDLCYYNVSTSKWDLAKADVAATSGGVKLGMCILAGNANAATEMLLYGKINAAAKFPTLTIGAVCYISAATAGLIVAGATNATTGQPSATDNVIRIIGWANTADELYFSPDQTYITHT